MYDFFISYRRTDEGNLAANHLKRLFFDCGKTVFQDVDSIVVDLWERQVNNAIANCSNFVLVVTDGCFQKHLGVDHFLNEIDLALRLYKTITPIIFSGDISKKTLPPNLIKIRDYQSIKLSPNYFDAFINKIITHFGLQNLHQIKVEHVLPYTEEDSSRNNDQQMLREYYKSLFNKR